MAVKTRTLVRSKPRAVVSRGERSIAGSISWAGPISRKTPDAEFAAGDGYGRLPGDISQPYAAHAWVYACVRALSQNISSVPLRVLGGSPTNPEDFSPEDPGNAPGTRLAQIFVRPNPYMTGFQLFEATTALMNLDGTAVWLLDRQTVTEVPAEITVVPCWCVRANLTEDGRIASWEYRQPGGQYSKTLSLAQVLLFKFFNPYDPIWGLAPLEAARRGVRVDVLAQAYSEDFFANNAEPAGVLTSDRPLARPKMQEILDFWENRHRGIGKSGKVGIVYGGVKWQPTSTSQKDMEFVEQQKWNRDQILAVFKVPKTEISLFEDVNYASSLSQDRSFWQKTLVPILRNIEAVLNAHFARWLRPVIDQRLRFQYDLANVPALQDDFSEKLKNADILYRLGYPPNIINQRLNLGLPEIAWGDTVFINGALVDVEVLAKFGMVPGGKPFGPTVPGPTGQPGTVTEPKPTKAGSAPTNASSTYPKGKPHIVRTTTSPRFQTQTSDPALSTLKDIAEKMRDEVRAHLRRLRAHQLSLTVRTGGVFDAEVWSAKLEERLVGLYVEAARLFGVEEWHRAMADGRLPLTDVDHALHRTILGEQARSDRSFDVDRAREVFAVASSRPNLSRLCHLEMARLIRIFTERRRTA